MSAKEQNKTTLCFGKIYDALAQTISILDVITDIIVCIGFYQDDRMIFFGISLAILILALIAYDALFVINFSREWEFSQEVALFFSMLPISPFIPFIFYYSDKPDSCIPRFIKKHCCFSVDFHGSSHTKDASKFKQFFESKIQKHAGFIVESLVEAFPQAILQMTAIVIYKETNITSIISILISMLSVASKSFVFSMGTASNLKQLFFNWLSAVTDFFGIFFVVCWVFYEPRDEYLKDGFVTIREVWLYKLYIFEFPTVLIPSFTAYCAYIFAVSTEDWDNSCCCYRILIGILGFFAFSFIEICIIIASILGIEITCWTWTALTFLCIGTSRFPNWHKLSLEFWFTLIEWINSAQKHHIGSKYKGCTSFTKQQDYMMRLCSVNWIAISDNELTPNGKDDKLMKYLERNQKENQYMNVTMKGIRMNTLNDESRFHERFWKWYGEIWRELKNEHETYRDRWRTDRTLNGCSNCCFYTTLMIAVGSLTFVLGPIYFISRFIHLAFPWFIVIYLYFGYNVNIWNTRYIDIFQIVMITIYMILCVILMILFYFNVKEQYLMAHLLPNKSYLDQIQSNEQFVENKIKKITNHYYGITFIPIRRAMLIEKFGDLGQIIVSYLPNDDDFDVSAGVTRAKVV